MEMMSNTKAETEEESKTETQKEKKKKIEQEMKDNRAIVEKNRQLHPTGLESCFSLQNHKKLRWGYTTGSAATAAAKAAAEMLMTGKRIEEVALKTPKGILLHLLLEEISLVREENDPYAFRSVSCAVRKDGGDDIDATHGLLIFATVEKIEEPEIRIDGGKGVGRVTLPGVDQKIGEAAINSMPRKMIQDELEEVRQKYHYSGGFSVVIRVPGGEVCAEKTFNPRLGIVGGISILGTTGIVLPMSEMALIESIRVEMKMLYENGGKYLVVTPGNYGEVFASKMPDLDRTYEMKSSNYVGNTIEMAEEIGVSGILFVSHIGKFIKLAGGIMNTHSHQADCRLELMAAALLRTGGRAKTCRRVLNSITTEDALTIIKEEEPELFYPAMDEIGRKVQFYLNQKTQGRVRIGAVIFSSVLGKLTETEDVPYLKERLKEQGEAQKA